MKIAFIGDIALFGRLSLTNNPHLSEYFKDVADYLHGEDLVIGNLESPFSVVKRIHGAKSAYLYSDPDNVEVLKWLNISAVSLANNHMFDYGKEGYETTKKLLTENGIEWFGSEGRDILIEVQGSKLAISGFCCYSSGPRECVPYGKYGVNEYNLGHVSTHIKNYSNSGYLNVVCVHAGKEHVNYPSLDTIKAARLLATESPILYIGHHPHVAQGIERINGGLIAYSLGNFCFDDVYSSVSDKPLIELSDNNRNSFILEVKIESNQIVDYSIVPIYIGKEKMFLNKGITYETIVKYTEPIHQLSEAKYEEMRTSLLNEYVEERKNKRNLSWYIKRLRPRYVKILLYGKSNKKKYNNSIKRFLK